jgi:hypothetical protein
MSSNERSADRLGLQKHILPILATFADGSVDCIGTGFITYANGRQAHLVTAAHVIEEIRKIDNPDLIRNLSIPNILRRILYRFEIKHARPRAIYFDGTTAHAATIEAAVEMAKVDLALCSIRFDDNAASEAAFTSRFALDTTPEREGPVHHRGMG